MEPGTTMVTICSGIMENKDITGGHAARNALNECSVNLLSPLPECEVWDLFERHLLNVGQTYRLPHYSRQVRRHSRKKAEMACKAIFDFSPRIPRAYRSSVPLIGKTTSDTFRRRYQQDENLECLSNNSRETPHL